MNPRARDDVLLRQLDAEEWVLYDPERHEVHVLNATAAMVWLHCTGDNDTAGVACALGLVFGTQVTDATLRCDVEAALERFRSLGLVT